jgi:hypothetical protein
MENLENIMEGVNLFDVHCAHIWNFLILLMPASSKIKYFTALTCFPVAMSSLSYLPVKKRYMSLSLKKIVSIS